MLFKGWSANWCWSVNFLLLAHDVLSIEIECKYSKTFIAIWHCHEIQTHVQRTHFSEWGMKWFKYCWTCLCDMCCILAMHSKTMCQITLKSNVLEDSMVREEDRSGGWRASSPLFPRSSTIREWICYVGWGTGSCSHWATGCEGWRGGQELVARLSGNNKLSIQAHDFQQCKEFPLFWENKSCKKPLLDTFLPGFGRSPTTPDTQTGQS